MTPMEVLIITVFAGLLFALMVLSSMSASNSYDVGGCEQAHKYATYTSVVSGLVVLSILVAGGMYMYGNKENIMAIF
jgi:hypothetical protein